MNQYIGIYRRCELAFFRSRLEPYHLAPLEGKVLLRLAEAAEERPGPVKGAPDSAKEGLGSDGEASGAVQEELGAYFEVDKGRMAKVLFALEEQKLVSRGVNENNRRQKLVALTPEGRRIVEQMKQVSEEWDTMCFQGFSQEERQQYMEFVRRITENVTERRRGQGGYGHDE